MTVKTAAPVFRRIDRMLTEARERQHEALVAGDLEVHDSFTRSIDRLLEERHALALRQSA